jgi:hypothetical protein
MTRNQFDGRTVREKAQDMKRMANLEGVEGNTKSSRATVLSSSEISMLAVETGISIGKNEHNKESIRVIREYEANRADPFSSQCSTCQGNVDKDKVSIDESMVVVVAGDDAPSARVSPKMISQVDECFDLLGQWTLVLNRKKFKYRLLDERDVLEY